jgi:polysaccharide biosynthesis protein PslG
MASTLRRPAGALARVQGRRLISMLALAAGFFAITAANAFATATLGFNDNAVHMNQVPADTDAQLTAQVGGKITRETLDWRWAEPYKGQYRLADYDALYQADLAQGVKPIFTVAFAPSWALGPESNCNQWQQNCRYLPGSKHIGDWQNFVYMIAKRYPQAAAIELWNEPNLQIFSNGGVDPARYTRVLKAGYSAVKSANPNMTVLAGGLSDNQVTGGGNMSESDFLTGIYANGGKNSMDGISIHAYPTNAYNGTLTLTSLDQARTIRASYGDPNKPLWVTEVGVSTTNTAPGWQIDEAGQATDTMWFWNTLSVMGDVKAVLFHTLIDPTWMTDPKEVGFGLLHGDLTPKAAYCQLSVGAGGSYRCP